jgi:hypothetical protein
MAALGNLEKQMLIFEKSLWRLLVLLYRPQAVRRFIKTSCGQPQTCGGPTLMKAAIRLDGPDDDGSSSPDSDGSPGLGAILLSHFVDVVRRYLGGALVLSLNRLVDLLTVYGHLARRFDSKPDFVSSNIDDRHDDVVADDDALVALSGKHKHRWLLPAATRDSLLYANFCAGKRTSWKTSEKKLNRDGLESESVNRHGFVVC